MSAKQAKEAKLERLAWLRRLERIGIAQHYARRLRKSAHRANAKARAARAITEAT